jgi:hypothetical protein
MRTWREIAKELSHEYNSDRLLALSEELIKTFDEQPPDPDQKKRPESGKGRQAKLRN